MTFLGVDIGTSAVKAVIVDDSEGLAAALDQAMQESVDGARDVWLERDQPATPNQFRTTLKVIGEPA